MIIRLIKYFILKRQLLSRLPPFKNPNSSLYKQWFNENRTRPIPFNNNSIARYGFDILLFWAADQDYQNHLTAKTPIEKIKKRNEIITYEIGCYYLSVLLNLLSSKGHKDSTLIFGPTINLFSEISSKIFNQSIEESKERTIARVTHYFSITNSSSVLDKANLIAIQISNGFEKEEPTNLSSYAKNNKGDFEIAILAEMTLVSIQERDGGVKDTWEKLFYGPLYKTNTI